MNLPALTVNPVLRRELVERMRSRTTMIVLTAYLALLSGSLYLVYGQTRNVRADPFQSGVSAMAGAGRSIFECVVFVMVLLVLFLVPGATSAAVAGERERQTLVPLQVTLLGPTSIVLGKVGASVAYLLLLLVATTPLLALCYLIGGVSIGQVLSAVAVVAVIGVALGAVSAGISACVRRVQTATVLAYGFSLALSLGTVLAIYAADLVDESRGTDSANPPAWILVPNPLAAVADLIDEDRAAGRAGTWSPFDIFVDRLNAQNGLIDTIEVPGPDGEFFLVGIDANGNEVELDGRSEGTGFLWRSLGLLALLAVASVAIGARRLRAPAAVER